MYGYIYKRMNKLNGMLYVGMHKYDKPELDKNYRGSGVLFNEELKIFGDDAFTYELVDTADTYEALGELEKYYIALFDCRFPKGYNVHPGGCEYIYNPNTSDRFTLSEYSKYLWQQPEYRNKVTKAMSLGHIGRPSGMKGHRFNEEELERFRMNSIGRKWFTDDEVEVFVYECPLGFHEGRIDRAGFKSNLGNIWITDGVTTIAVLPDQAEEYYKQGFTRGRTLDYTASEETRAKMREKSAGDKNAMYGKHYVAVSRNGMKKRIPPEKLDEYLADGWIKGWKKI